jgi:alkylated DNA repair protein alkB family protein 4
MKINGKSFDGFPSFSKEFQDKLRAVESLRDYQTIEQCSIEYRTETGACIDPHIDDCWVWGERVISLSLISDSVLTMTKYEGGVDKYNLRYHYETTGSNGDAREETPTTVANSTSFGEAPIVRIPMPARSLLVLYGPARYEWEHCVIRSDIKDRRICMAYREFTPEYLPGGKSYGSVGKEVCDRANNFWEPQNVCAP